MKHTGEPLININAIYSMYKAERVQLLESLTANMRKFDQSKFCILNHKCGLKTTKTVVIQTAIQSYHYQIYFCRNLTQTSFV